MNFLAHLYLSGDSDEIRIGNFIGDSVKGKYFDNFPKGIQQGISLHRKIDYYTDNHKVVKRSIVRLRPYLGKYAGVAIDMFYDHFLAANWEQYSSEKLDEFIQSSYKIMNDNMEFLPDRTKHMLPHMIADNWLLSYADVSGIDKALKGMARRTTFESNLENASSYLEKNYSSFKADFEEFFPDLKDFVSRTISSF